MSLDAAPAWHAHSPVHPLMEAAVALKPTIYKLRINLSDLDRNLYDSLSLTVAQHPSESLERMMVRVLAYCLNAQEHLSFTKGLSSTDEPEIWARTLEGSIALWIDVGEPEVDRIKKASRIAAEVKVYSFNSKSAVWWSQVQQKFAGLGVSVYQLDWSSVQALAKLVSRTMDLSVTVSGESAYVASEAGGCDVSWKALQLV